MDSLRKRLCIVMSSEYISGRNCDFLEEKERSVHYLVAFRVYLADVGAFVPHLKVFDHQSPFLRSWSVMELEPGVFGESSVSRWQNVPISASDPGNLEREKKREIVIGKVVLLKKQRDLYAYRKVFNWVFREKCIKMYICNFPHGVQLLNKQEDGSNPPLQHWLSIVLSAI